MIIWKHIFINFALTHRKIRHPKFEVFFPCFTVFSIFPLEFSIDVNFCLEIFFVVRWHWMKFYNFTSFPLLFSIIFDNQLFARMLCWSQELLIVHKLWITARKKHFNLYKLPQMFTQPTMTKEHRPYAKLFTPLIIFIYDFMI